MEFVNDEKELIGNITENKDVAINFLRIKCAKAFDEACEMCEDFAYDEGEKKLQVVIDEI